MPGLPYPIRTEPFFRDYLWGGRRLESWLGKPIPSEGVWAESWEMIDHWEHQSLISNGSLLGKSLHEVAQLAPKWLLGSDSRQRLPLLLKYLDCQKVLSVQVHPNDNYAMRMTPPDLGKTEAWYIIDAAPGAVLYAGLRPDVDATTLRTAMERGTVESCLHVIEPRAGDCVFIPAGTVHALGAGLLVAEIQQASNTTFRLFDWNRVGPDGKSRQLHVDEAIEVTDFRSGPRNIQQPIATSQAGREHLVECDKFILDRITGITETTIAGDGKFHCLTVPKGSVAIEGAGFLERLSTGDSALLPAASPEFKLTLDPGSVLLDSYLPDLAI